MTSWNGIVCEHGRPTYRVAWRILRHSQDCEDVLQDVFMEAHKLFTAGKVMHWRTFLNRLATYRALDSLRRRKPMDDFDRTQPHDKSPSPEELAIEQEEATTIESRIPGASR